MGDNKLLDLILEKIENICDENSQKNFNSRKTNNNYEEKSFFLLYSLCEMVVNGTDDEDLESAITRLKKIPDETFDRNYKFTAAKMILIDLIDMLEKRQETVKLLQEGYSGKCIL